jgi:hypothetical protein
LELTRDARTPSADDKERIGRRLAGALAFGATSAHAGAATTTKAVGTTVVGKWAIVAMVAAASGVGYLGVRPKPATAPVVTPNAPALTEPTAHEDAVVEPPMPEAPPAANERAAPRDDEPRHPTAAKSAPRATLPEELDLLHEAQAKWRSGNAPAALSLIAEHRARFPRSALGPERDALAILSLCATNRVADAKRLARHFLATAPRSPLKTSVEESCGGNGRE